MIRIKWQATAPPDRSRYWNGFGRAGQASSTRLDAGKFAERIRDIAVRAG
jgi:hypothetical protein